MDNSKYKALFLQETGEHIAGIEKGLLELEKEAAQSTVDNLFRHYHSIKGMSASMGYDGLALFAHAQEDLLDKVRSKKIPVTGGIISTLLSCLDALKTSVKKIEDDDPSGIDTTRLVEALKALASGEAPVPVPGAATGVAPAEAGPQLNIPSVMKVDGRVFDDLLAIVGELFMSLSSFKALGHNLRSIQFKDGVHSIGKSIKALHESILSARMLPLEDLIEGLPRVIRDITRRTGKSVELKIEGAQIRLDRAVLEGLGSPLVHIIRNAVDHGIEPPQERLACGKPSTGLITMHAYSKRERVVIEVFDDGKGIDIKKIKEKAVSKGVITAERAASLSAKEALMLVCTPGLSGADVVTDTSGRGVGMDVVKGAIEDLGGRLDMESVRGFGTKMILELPRTSSIVKALILNAGGEQFLAPVSRIVKVFEVERAKVSGGTVEHEGNRLPVIQLASAMGIEDETSGETYTVIITEYETNGSKAMAAVLADDFEDEIDAYVKPLLPPISKLWGVSGIMVMGDGRPVFLIDLSQIVTKALASR